MFKNFWNWLKNWFMGDYTPGAQMVNQAEQGNVQGINVGNIENGISGLFNTYTGADLTGAQKAMNEFNAEEAQKTRDWQTEMDNTKYQRTVDDMRAAGVNPALMFGGASVSSPPSGATASGSLSSGRSMSDLIQLITLPATLKGMKKQREAIDSENAQRQQDINESKARERNYEKDTELKEAQRQLLGKQLDFFDVKTKADLDAIYSLIGQREVQNQLTQQDISESKAREIVALNQALLLEMDAQSRERLNQLEVQLKEARVAFEKQQTEESKARVKRVTAEIADIYASALEHNASAGFKNAQTKTEAEHLQLVRASTTGQHISNQQQQYVVDHQEVQRFVENGTAITRAIGSVLTGASAAAIAVDKLAGEPPRTRIGYN